MTTIRDTLTYAGGRKVNGQVVVSWPAFQWDGTAVAGGMETYPILDGALEIRLYSNVSARPIGMYYTATYELEEGAIYTEYWIIPNLPLVNLGQVRIGFPVAPSAMISALQLTSAGAGFGQFLGWDGTHWVPMYVTTINISPNTIGLTLSGDPDSDLSVSGSPARLGQGLFLNVPDAGPTSRGVVTTGAQTFAGAKTFTDTVSFPAGVSIGGGSLIAGFVPDSRLVATGYGLTGGGPLTADLTLAAVDNTTIQKITLYNNTVFEGTRRALNLLAGPNVILTVQDNPAMDWVDVFLNSTGMGEGPTLPSGSVTGDTLVWESVPGPGFWGVLPKGPAGSVLTATATAVTWTPRVALQTPWLSDIDGANYILRNVNRIGVGMASPQARVDSAGMIRVTDTDPVPASGAGLELFYDTAGPKGFILAYDRGSSAYRPLVINSDPLTLNMTGAHVGIGILNPGALLHVHDTKQVSLLAVFTTDPGNPAAQVYAGIGLGVDAVQPFAAIYGHQTSAGTFSEGDLLIYTRTGETLVERVRVQNNGYVGIGTTNPQALLHISKNVPGALGPSLWLDNPGTQPGAAASIDFVDTAFAQPISARILVTDEGQFTHGFSFQTRIPGSQGNPCVERMHILGANGYVGIGTSTPNAPLSFANVLGNKIFLWDGGPGDRYGFGIQNAQLQIFCNDSLRRVSIGYGDSNAFTETLTITGGRVGVNVWNPAVTLDVNGQFFPRDGVWLAGGDLTNRINGATWYGLGWTAYGPQLAGYGGLNLQTANINLRMTPSRIGVGLGGADPLAEFHVYGFSGQAIPYDPWGQNGGALYVQDSGGGWGNGGILLLGAGYQSPFAAVKAFVTNGGAYSAGDLLFLTRPNINDNRLFEAMRIRNDAHVGINSTNPVDMLTIGDMLGGSGHLRLVQGGYGVIFRQDGGSFYLLVTNPGDPYGGWRDPLRPFTVDLGSGGVAMSQSLNVGSTISAGFDVNVTNAVRVGSTAYVGQGGDLGVARNSSPGTGVVYFGNSGTQYIYWDGGNFNLTASTQIFGNVNVSGGNYFLNGAPFGAGLTVQAQYTTQGTFSVINFIHGTNANVRVLPSGSTITVAYDVPFVSDLRIKRNIRDLTGGLSVINQLRPVEAEFNGLGCRPEGKRTVSVIAQELEQVLPGAVYPYRTPMHAGDTEETELLSIDPYEILFQALLAIQQLSQCVKALEAKVS